MKALLLIDIQNDFLPQGALAVPHGDEIVPIVNQLQSAFSCIIATKDWHPSRHISFASTHGLKPGSVIEVNGKKQELWPDHCVQHTPGTDFPASLETDKIQKVFFKGIHPDLDSYSAFYDNAHERSTGLEDYLHKLGIRELYIAGLATDYCVKYSVLDARQLQFAVYVVVDACRGIDLHPGDIQKAIQEMETAGACIIKSHQL